MSTKIFIVNSFVLEVHKFHSDEHEDGYSPRLGIGIGSSANTRNQDWIVANANS